MNIKVDLELDCNAAPALACNSDDKDLEEINLKGQSHEKVCEIMT
jgi:hypothetical protein